MSEQKDYERYLKGEYYPGAPKTQWRLDFEAYMAAKAVAPAKISKVVAKPARKRSVVKESTRRKCTEPGCKALLYSNSTYDKCRKHATKLRMAKQNERRRRQRRDAKVAA